jgi:hypothetical protein
MRRVVILLEAAEDIEAARDFYDAQQPGIGDYCADSLVADIESLALYHGIHLLSLVFTGCSRTVFPSAFITGWPRTKPRSVPFWICGATRGGCEKNWPGAVSEARGWVRQSRSPIPFLR